MTIFLDTDDHYLVASSRRGMVDALLTHLPDEPDDEQLVWLAAACLGCQPLDVMIIHSP